MKNRTWRYIVAIMSVIYLVGSTVMPVKAASTYKAPRAGTAPTTSPKQNWDSLVAAAKKEGTVSIYALNWGPQTRVAVIEAFKAKYGINVEFSPFKRCSELQAKV